MFNSKKCLTSFVAAVCLLGAAALSPAAEPAKATGGSLEKKDLAFVTEAAQGGMLEVSAGKLAEEKATNPELKKAGGMIMKDHAKANEELKKIAKNKGVDFPVMADRKSAALIEKLAKKDGADFDKAWLEELEKDHKEDIEKFEAATKEVKDPELLAFAEKNLPVLRKHLEHIQELKGK